MGIEVAGAEFAAEDLTRFRDNMGLEGSKYMRKFEDIFSTGGL